WLGWDVHESSTSPRLEPTMSELADGIYEQLITHGIDGRLALLQGRTSRREQLDPADAHELLARHVGELARRAVRSVGGDDQASVAAQVDLANRIARAIVELAPDVNGQDDFVASPADLLYAITRRAELPGLRQFPPRPEVPLSASALLVNGRGQPRIGSEVNLELASADQVDLLCAFVKFHGVRVLEEQIANLVDRGGTLRVITTTYMGATERKALDRLAGLGADI